MARSKRVSGDNVVDVLRDIEKPYATTTDIAEGLDVTAQTIRNNASELAKDARINKGKVGQSSVYWLADEGEPPASREGKPPNRSPDVEQWEHTGEETPEDGEDTLQWGEPIIIEDENGDRFFELEAEYADNVREIAKEEGNPVEKSLRENLKTGMVMEETKQASGPTGFAGWTVQQAYKVGALSVRLSVATLFVTLMLYTMSDVMRAVANAALLSVALAVAGGVLVLSAVAIQVLLWGGSFRDQLFGVESMEVNND